MVQFRGLKKGEENLFEHKFLKLHLYDTNYLLIGIINKVYKKTSYNDIGWTRKKPIVRRNDVK